MVCGVYPPPIDSLTTITSSSNLNGDICSLCTSARTCVHATQALPKRRHTNARTAVVDDFQLPRTVVVTRKPHAACSNHMQRQFDSSMANRLMVGNESAAPRGRKRGNRSESKKISARRRLKKIKAENQWMKNIHLIQQYDKFEAVEVARMTHKGSCLTLSHSSLLMKRRRERSTAWQRGPRGTNHC